MKTAIGIILAESLIHGSTPAVAAQRAVGFDEAGALTDWKLSGIVRIDTERKHSGHAGLRVGPRGKAVLPLRGKNGTGRIDLWVYEDGAAPAAPKKRGAGALVGLRQADGRVLAVGAIYAPYLSGHTTYAAGVFDPAKGERPWQNVQYLAVRRRRGWHNWTFDFDPEKGLRVLFDGKDVNASRKVFLWNKTGLQGFTDLILLGDKTGSGQVLWVDDLRIDLGPPARTKPKWPPPPPPPPADLTPVPPLAPHVTAPYARWAHGPGKTGDFFPIAVWLQAPENAERYKALGFNLYIGLWKGPTEAQLAILRKARMPVICAQNAWGLRHLDDPMIVGWMHGDEPDNAQSFDRTWGGDPGRIAQAWPQYANRSWHGYGPPLSPAQIVAEYNTMHRNDPSRPVCLNLGQGVAWDNWHGRGVRSNRPEDYSEYVKGCDIVSFDIYPVVHSSLEVAGALWRVPYGVTRLRNWTHDRKAVWNCIECTRISNPAVKPTPRQVLAEVWMSIVFGSRGLIYFVHQFKPKFIEAALLADPEMQNAVGATNHRIQSLASVINAPPVTMGTRVTCANPAAPVCFTVRQTAGFRYIFAVGLTDNTTVARFELSETPAAAVDVLDEQRTLPLKAGQFADTFKGWDVHIYRVRLEE